MHHMPSTSTNVPQRLAGASGVAFVLLSLALAVTAPAHLPSIAWPADAVVGYFVKHQAGLLIGNYLAAVALLPGIILILYLALAIRDAEPGRGYLWLLVLVTNSIALAAAVTIFALLQAAAVVAPSSPPLVKALADASNMSFGFFFLPQAAAVLAAAWGFRQTGTMSPAIAWAGVPVAIVMLVASVGTIVTTEPLTAGGLVTVVAFVLFLLWLLATSIVLLTPAKRPLPSVGPRALEVPAPAES